MQFRWTVPLSFVFDLPDLSNAAFGDDIKSLYENINVYDRLKVSREKEKQQQKLQCHLVSHQP